MTKTERGREDISIPERGIAVPNSNDLSSSITPTHTHMALFSRVALNTDTNGHLRCTYFTQTNQQKILNETH